MRNVRNFVNLEFIKAIYSIKKHITRLKRIILKKTLIFKHYSVVNIQQLRNFRHLSIKSKKKMSLKCYLTNVYY